MTENLGGNLDLTLQFRDRHGNDLKLSSLINGEKPTILAPVYYSCPGLCTAILDTVRNLIGDIDLDLGDEYQVINVSFDPTNTPELADAKSKNYRSTLPEEKVEAAEKAWYFLTGEQDAITALMNRVGFHYKFINGQYSHVATLILISPEGKITRYLSGVGMGARDTKLALVEASGGKVGSPWDRAFSYCFRYDPTAGKYVPWAWRILRIGGVLTLIVMGIGGYLLWKSEFVRKRRQEHNV